MTRQLPLHFWLDLCRRPAPHFTVPLPDGRALDLGARTLVMGIVNVTPDSFADGGVRFDPDVARSPTRCAMVADGADIIDIGGESTRPGRRRRCRPTRSWRRVVPVLEGLRGRRRRADLDRHLQGRRRRARDRSGRGDRQRHQRARPTTRRWPRSSRRRGAAVVLMHNRGRSRDMYAQARYTRRRPARWPPSLRARVARRRGRRHSARAGSSSTPAWASRSAPSTRCRVLAGLPRLAALGCPLLVGPSRKSFLHGRARRRPARPSGSGARRPPSPPPSSSARTSCGSTTCRRWSRSCAWRTRSAIERCGPMTAMAPLARCLIAFDTLSARSMNQFVALFHRPPLSWWDVVDILIVSVLIYEALKLIRGTRAMQMAIGSRPRAAPVLRVAACSRCRP